MVQRARQTFRRILGIAALSALMGGVLVGAGSTGGAAAPTPAPVVTSVSPSSGLIGDVAVRIFGTDFTGATAVSFGAEAAPNFVVEMDTQIVVNSPPGMVGTVDVTVTTPAGTSAASPMDRFTFTAPEGPSSSPPVVTSLSPSSGPAPNDAPFGDQVAVTVNGSNFIGATAVHFGSVVVSPSDFFVNSSSQITLGSPGAPAGTVVDVTVTTAAGTSALSAGDKFTYTAALPAAGYWEVASDGGIFSFGNAPFLGSMGGTHLNAPVVGMAVDPFSGGYWEVASDGGIFSFGGARFRGSMGGTHVNSPIVGMAVDPTSGGYWEVASDGGIFSFGNAPFLGSLGGMHLSSPIVGMAASAGEGYWLVAANGAVYAFGAAPNLGSVANSLSTPVVSITPDTGGEGYWLVTANGGLITFGTAPNDGSTAGFPLNKPIVGMATRFDINNKTLGYWEVGSDGGIFTFGTPDYYGSMGGVRLNAPIVGMAPTQLPTSTVIP
jgi:hypothetical protein